MRPIDAEPIERTLFKVADKSLAKNPYENARVCAFRQALELILGTPTISSPPNAPLTLEELREMDGEPVWIVQEGCDGCWALISAVSAMYIHTYGCGVLEIKHYGKDWWAYRRKPEEGKG